MAKLKLKYPRKTDFLDDSTGTCVLCGGRKYPDGMLVTREGKTYCRPHYKFRYHHRDLDAQILNLEDDE